MLMMLEIGAHTNQALRTQQALGQALQLLSSMQSSENPLRQALLLRPIYRGRKLRQKQEGTSVHTAPAETQVQVCVIHAVSTGLTGIKKFGFKNKTHRCLAVWPQGGQLRLHL